MSQQTDDLQAWLQNLGIDPQPKKPKQPSPPPVIKKPKAKVKMAAKAMQKKEVPALPVASENDAYSCEENRETEAQDATAYQTDNNAYTEVEVNNDIHSSVDQEQKKKKSPHHGLFEASNLKNAIIIQEVLGKPKSLR